MLRHLGCIIRACDLPGILLGTSDLAQGFAHYARPLKLAFLDALDALCFGLHCLFVVGQGQSCGRLELEQKSAPSVRVLD